MPKVSAIICVYNQPLVREAIESALNQNYSDFELIVINDGSTDRTPQVLAGYQDRAIISRQPNQGVAAARNRGLSLARGEYLAFLDADDIWLPDYLKEQADFLDANPQFSMSFTDGWMVWKNEIPDNIQSLPSHYSLYPPPSGKDAAENFFNSPVVTSFMMLRRTLFEKVGFFDPALTIHEDADLLLRGLEQGMEFGFLPKPLAIKRNLESGLAADAYHGFQLARDMQLDSFRRSKKFRPFLRRTIPLTDRLIARGLLEKGKKTEARKHLLEAFMFRPWALRTLILWMLLFLPEPVPTFVLTRNILPPDKKRLYGAAKGKP